MKKTQMRRLLSVVLMIALLQTTAGCGLFGLVTPYQTGRKPSVKEETDNDGNDVAAAALALPQENPRSGCGVKRYDMELTLDPGAHELTGSVAAEVVNRTDQTMAQLCFRFFAAVISPGSAIEDAGSADGKRRYTFREEKDPSVVFVDLGDDAVPPGGRRSVRLEFTSVIPRIDDRFGYHASADGTVYNLSFCFPQLSFLRDGVWDTDPYYDEGETAFNELSDYSVTLNAPESFQVLSSGTAETKNGVTTITAKKIRELAITACDFGGIAVKEADGVRYRLLTPTYRFGDDDYRAALYDLLLETAISAVAYYSRTVGPYCYDELDIVPVPMSGSGGMEMPGLIYIGVCADMDNDDGTAARDSIANVFDTVAHEVSHEWFYCAVGNDQYDEAWLDEAFAMFCASEYMKEDTGALRKMEEMAKTYNGEAHAAENYIESAYQTTYPETVYINLSCGDYVDVATYVTAVYDRGYAFLHSLYEIMGEETYYKMISEWYKENDGKIVTGRLFVAKVLSFADNDRIRSCLNSYLSDRHL